MSLTTAYWDHKLNNIIIIVRIIIEVRIASAIAVVFVEFYPVATTRLAIASSLKRRYWNR